LPGVRIVRVPDWGEPTRLLVLGVLVEGMRLLARRPWRLPRLVRAVRRVLPKSARPIYVLALVRSYLPLARLRPDVVHFEWNPDAVHYLPLTEVWRCPTVTSCHGGGVSVYPHAPDNRRLRNGLPETFRRVDAVHCVSGATAAEAGRWGLDPAAARIIHPAVDPAFFHPPPTAAAGGPELRLVAVSWLRWLKGYEYALLAVRRLLDRGVPVRLDVLGAEPHPPQGPSGEVQRMRFTIDDLALSDRVALHGHVSSETVRARLHQSDALLHASLAEGIPTVVLEAMACALPVVVTDCGGVREAVRDGVEGFVVPPREPDAIARALEQLWREPALRTEMGQAGRERVVAEFGLERQVRSYMVLYHELTRARAG